ncbi:MAG: CPBP family intramembrane metalloprotease, partial [Siphonobacter sp.]
MELNNKKANMIMEIYVKIKQFVRFVKNPDNPEYAVVSTSEKLKEVSVYYLIIAFAGCACLWYGVKVMEKLGLIPAILEDNNETDPLLLFLSIIVIAPLIEEFIFRYFLGIYRNIPYFKWIYYVDSILFGSIH